MAKKPKKKHNPIKKEKPNKEGIMTSGRVIPPYLNMRRNELAKLVKNPGQKTKDELIAELSQ